MRLELQKLIDVALPTYPTIFKDKQIEVLNQLIKYQDYYDNDVFKYIVEKYPEYGTRVSGGKNYYPTQVPLNYSRYIINKLASWQFEIPVDFNCTSDSEEVLKVKKKAAKKEIKPMRSDEIEVDIYETHKRNLMDVKLLQAAVECNVSGGVVFKLKYDIDKEDIRIFVRNRIECFPIYDFDDYENITKIHFVAFRDEDTIWKQTYELENGICYIEEAIYDAKMIEKPKEVIIPRQPLGIGKKYLDFIPVYIIPNTPQIGEIWGMSELEDLIPIIDEINRKYSDLSDSLRFDLFAITILMNVKPTGKNPEKGLKAKPGAVWELMGGGPDSPKSDVFKLEGQFHYIESLKYHIDSLVAALYEFSEVVNVSVDRISKVGNLSGVALKLLFAAILSKTTRKNAIWGARLREMYMGILKMKQIYEGYDLPDDLDIEIITHNPLPQNELENIQVITQKITAGLISVTTAMNELGVEDPERELAQILEEKNQYDKSLNLDNLRSSHNTGDTENE